MIVITNQFTTQLAKYSMRLSKHFSSYSFNSNWKKIFFKARNSHAEPCIQSVKYKKVSHIPSKNSNPSE